MIQFHHIVRDPLGFHARPCGVISEQAACFRSKIIVSKGKKRADALRLFDLLALGVRYGDEITFLFEGEDENAACAKFRALMERQY